MFPNREHSLRFVLISFYWVWFRKAQPNSSKIFSVGACATEPWSAAVLDELDAGGFKRSTDRETH